MNYFLSFSGDPPFMSHHCVIVLCYWRINWWWWQWLDGVGQAGTNDTADGNEWKDETSQMSGGHSSQQSYAADWKVVLVRIGPRGQDTKCVAISWTLGLGRTTKRWGGNIPVRPWRHLYMCKRLLIFFYDQRGFASQVEKREKTPISLICSLV